MNEEQQINENQDTQRETPPVEVPTGSRPTAKFTGSGGLVVSIWKSKTTAGFDNYSVTLERNYRKDDGTFDAAKSLRDSDLLRAQQLLTVADAWIEQDKAKGRGQASGAASTSVAR